MTTVQNFQWNRMEVNRETLVSHSKTELLKRRLVRGTFIAFTAVALAGCLGTGATEDESESGSCEDSLLDLLTQANDGETHPGLVSDGGISATDFVDTYGPYNTENLSCQASIDSTSPPNAEAAAVVTLEEGFAVIFFFKQEPDGTWVPMTVEGIGGGR